MKNKKQIIITTLLCLLPIGLGLYLWDDLPQQVAIHFGSNGEANGYAPKAVAVFALPVMLAVFELLTVLIINKDPKKEGQSPKVRQITYWLFPILSLMVVPLTFYKSLGKNIPVDVIIYAFLGLLFITMGNYLPKCKQNYTIGIKLPWTLNDADNWNYTHRLSGFVWVIGGFGMLVNCIINNNILLICVLGAILIFPFIFSFTYYLRHQDKQ